MDLCVNDLIRTHIHTHIYRDIYRYIYIDIYIERLNIKWLPAPVM